MADGSRPGVWLHYRAHAIEVPVGEFVIGRDRACQLMLDDDLISRRHALLSVRSGSVTIEDLGSRNGVLVNGAPIRQRHTLFDGDQITLGAQAMTLEISGDAYAPAPTPDSGPRSNRAPISASDLRANRAKADTMRPKSLPKIEDPDDVDSESIDATRIGSNPRSSPSRPPDAHVNALSLIGAIAEKALATGRVSDAERILRRPLEDVLASARAHTAVAPELAAQAASFAVRLAARTGDGAWVDYIVHLYSSLEALPPAAVVDQLYDVVRRVRTLDITALRVYINGMRERAPASGPTGRFVHKRLEGLERVVAITRR